MPCCLAVLAGLFPRIFFIVIWIFTDFVTRAYDFWLWPLLFLIFMPLTGLAYAYNINAYGGVEGWGIVFLIIAVVLDLGSWAGNAAKRGK